MNTGPCFCLLTYLLHHPFELVLSRFSRVQLFATSWTIALQAPLSMGFSRQESCCGLLCSLPGDLPNLGIEPRTPALQADSLLWATKEAHITLCPSPDSSSSGLDGEVNIYNFIIGKDRVVLSISRISTSKTEWSACVQKTFPPQPVSIPQVAALVTS